MAVQPQANRTNNSTVGGRTTMAVQPQSRLCTCAGSNSISIPRLPGLVVLFFGKCHQPASRWLRVCVHPSSMQTRSNNTPAPSLSTTRCSMSRADPGVRRFLEPDCECPRNVWRELGHTQRQRGHGHGDACAGEFFRRRNHHLRRRNTRNINQVVVVVDVACRARTVAILGASFSGPSEGASAGTRSSCRSSCRTTLRHTPLHAWQEVRAGTVSEGREVKVKCC
jgi:hypothetical protein